MTKSVSKFLLISVLLFPTFLFSQSLGKDRVEKIKNSTVKIITKYGSGTGFFVNGNGLLLTCWHVIDSSYWNNSPVTIEMEDGSSYNYGYLNGYTTDLSLLYNSVAFDFCFMLPLGKPIKTPFFLNVDDFSKVDEGDEIYTCGYPLGSQIQFISKGIVSTKYLDNNNSLTTQSGTRIKPRNEALLDVTLNPGNSGGAIVKMGTVPDSDVVIGIADFVINPFSKYADSLFYSFSNATKSGGGLSFGIGGIDSTGKEHEIASYDPFKIGSFFATVVKNMTNGISGCVSINYAIETIKEWLKDNGY